MRVEILGEILFSDLTQKIRQVPLMAKNPNGSNIYVYADANISLRELTIGEVNLTSFYVLKENMNFQRKLRKTLLAQGIDLLHLDRAYELRNQTGEVWTLTPPIVEFTPIRVKYIPREGELKYDDTVDIIVPVINDGMHRVSLAKELNETFNSVYISGVSPDYPIYAHPNDWSRLNEVDGVPSSSLEKKFYTRKDCYGLYRNFQVLGTGAPRGTSK